MFVLKQIILLILVLSLIACGGGSDNKTITPPTAANIAPTVDAGVEQNIDEQTTVTLTGTASDSDGTIAKYSWTQVSGEAVTLTGANTIELTFEAPTTIVDLSLVFKLTVTDDDDATAESQVTVNVRAVNSTPIVITESERTVPVNTNMSLAASASDQDGSISSIVWSQIDGDVLAISNADQLTLNVFIPQDYTGTSATFSVEVTDNEGAIATDEVVLTIEPALEFVEYVADVDPDPLEDVELIVDSSTSSITPATRSTDGYETFTVGKDSDYNFTVTDTNLTVTGTNSPNFQIGDIIAGVTADGMTGYMRKVTAINGSQITTEMATLTEAFPNAKLDLQIRIANNEITSNLSTKVNGQSISTRTVDLLNFDRHIESELAPGIKLVSDLQMNSGFDIDFGFSIIQRSITEFDAVASANYATTAYLDVDLPYEYSRQFNKSFNPIFETTKVVTIGVVPVVINVKAVPALGASVGMSAAGSLKYGFRNSANMETGFRYSNETINNIANFTPTLTQIGPDYSIEGGVNLQANASIAVIISLYEVSVDIPVVGKFEIDGPGIGIDLGPYAKFDVTASYNSTATPPLTCLLDFTAGLASNLSIDYGTIGQQLNIDNPENITLYDTSRALWHSNECPFDSKVGGLAGSVFDGDNSPIEDVSIEVINSNGDVVVSLTSDSSGLYNASELAIGNYTVNFSKNGYESASASIEVAENYVITVPQVLFLDEEEDGAVGTLSLLVVDAQDPTTIISGASIIVREGLNSPSGEYVTSFYSDDIFTESELPVGYYTLEISHDGYDTLYESIAISSAEVLNKSINLSSEGGGVGEGEARIVLTWGASPNDLDSHLTFTGYHIYYANRNGGGVNLDVDDVTSYGPETVTIDSVSQTDTYSYYIYNFSNSGTFSASQAQVKLYFDGTTRTFNAPGGTGYYWNVFDIVNGTLVPCNSGCVSSSPSGLNARRSAETFVMPPKESK